MVKITVDGKEVKAEDIKLSADVVKVISSCLDWHYSKKRLECVVKYDKYGTFFLYKGGFKMECVVYMREKKEKQTMFKVSTHWYSWVCYVVIV